VAKGFIQRKDIDYHETFSHVSMKDSFRIIMAVVAHFDLDLHQMDAKTTFIYRELVEKMCSWHNQRVLSCAVMKIWDVT
jgi:hypothetical protein